MQLIRCDNSLLSLLLLFFFKHYTIWNKKPLWETDGPGWVFPFINISLLAVRCDLYCQISTVACFTQPRQNLSVMAEIQYIKRDTFGIFTSNNKDHWWERLWGREKSLKWRQDWGGGGQSTQPETKEQVSNSGKRTACSFFTQLMLSCSLFFKEQLTKNRAKYCYFCQGEKKTKNREQNIQRV